ncbi:hypothetical protein KQX54_016966 [Cotesia glomerata]|uniref:Uncharacterized protein n=1 Tax=Cotesia glomerata TaxID=32391 RepID=A0AAV7I6U7_COTGL|nr:hypothetical protein KQX54_016966 [Cotesia glomerata]
MKGYPSNLQGILPMSSLESDDVNANSNKLRVDKATTRPGLRKPFSDRETRLSGQIQAMASIPFSPIWNQELFGQGSVKKENRNIQVHRVKSNGHLDLLVKDASAMQKTVWSLPYNRFPCPEKSFLITKLDTSRAVTVPASGHIPNVSLRSFGSFFTRQRRFQKLIPGWSGILSRGCTVKGRGHDPKSESYNEWVTGLGWDGIDTLTFDDPKRINSQKPRRSRWLNISRSFEFHQKNTGQLWLLFRITSS